MTKQMWMLNGLSCPNCAAKLEGALKRLPGMQEASVNFGLGSFKATYDPAVLSEDQIKATVKALDLEVASVVGA